MFARVALLFTTAAAARAAAAPPSFLFLLVDDGGFNVGVYGDNVTSTPHLDALANRRGAVTYDNAYVAVSSCSPSRSTILSGLPTHQNGMYGLHQYPGNFASNPDVQGLPNLLGGAGYLTGIVGKYHVGPVDAYDFEYGLGKHGQGDCWSGASDCMKKGGLDYSHQTRNITNMKLHARTFFGRLAPTQPFLLYVGFGDAHRCGYNGPEGSFCETYGVGAIPDWTPRVFTPAEMRVPGFLPDTPAMRQDLAGYYSATNRMDQGVGLMLAEVAAAGRADSTVVFFFSDNGTPFPSGKTNLFTRQGQGSPLIVVDPRADAAPARSARVASALDFVPTMLGAAGVAYPPDAKAGGRPAALTGTSLLTGESGNAAAYGSHNFHSLYAYYPSRSVVEGGYHYVHNVAPGLRYAILEDVATTDGWKDIVAAAEAGRPTGWVYNYTQYMHRPQYELYDTAADPLSLHNLAGSASVAAVEARLAKALADWQAATHDPWLPCIGQETALECSF